MGDGGQGPHRRGRRLTGNAVSGLRARCQDAAATSSRRKGRIPALVSIVSGGRMWRAIDESFGDGVGLSRTVAVAGIQFERKHGGDSADLLLQPPVAPFGTLEFGNVHVIAEVAYDPSLEALQEWWGSQQAPR